MIRAIFFDLDGTLLNRRSEISIRTREALNRCRGKGTRLFVATARPPMLDRMLSWDRDTLALFDGGVYHNGGCIEINGAKEYTHLPDQFVKDVIGLVMTRDRLNIALQMEGEAHAFRLPLDASACESWGLDQGEALSLDETGGRKTIKLLIYYANLIDSTEAIDQDTVAALEDLCRDTARFYLTDQGRCAQIVDQSIGKYEGVERIRERLGLRKDEVAVFGDDVNDLEMLSGYENSVAMGNAADSVKEAAAHVTLDHDCDGVAHAIEHILHI